MEWDTYHGLSTSKTALFSLVSRRDYEFLAESLSESAAFICASIPGQSVELFVCLRQSCQPHSWLNPSISHAVFLSPSFVLCFQLSTVVSLIFSCAVFGLELSMHILKNTANGNRLLWCRIAVLWWPLKPPQPPSPHSSAFSAELIFTLSNVSHNLPATTAGNRIHASYVHLTRQNVTLRRFLSGSSLKSGWNK